MVGLSRLRSLIKDVERTCDCPQSLTQQTSQYAMRREKQRTQNISPKLPKTGTLFLPKQDIIPLPDAFGLSINDLARKIMSQVKAVKTTKPNPTTVEIAARVQRTVAKKNNGQTPKTSVAARMQRAATRNTKQPSTK